MDEKQSEENTVFPQPTAETCPDCQVGTLQARTLTYFAMLEDQLLSIPDFPAWVCDVCRHCEYDDGALADLRSILGPRAKLPLEPSRPRRRPSDLPSGWAGSEFPKGQK